MTAAYESAEGGGLSPELQLAGLLDRYGAEAVLNRPLYAREIYRIAAAESVVAAYRQRQQAKDWVRWAHDNPEAARMLAHVENLINGG